MDHATAIEFYREAVRLQHVHARHARERGDELMARKAEERAVRAQQRLALALDGERAASRATPRPAV